MDHHQLNRDSYDAIADQWCQARRNFYGREADYLDAFLAGLPPRSLIVDAGCGHGFPMASHIHGKGFRVKGFDQSPALLSLAQQRLPDAQWELAALEHYPFVVPCRGILCWDALFHVERSHHEAIFRRMAAALPVGGRLMITVGGSAHPAFTDQMFGQTFFYDSHPPDTVLSLLADIGFVPLISEFMNPPTEGRDKGRYAIVARKAA